MVETSVFCCNGHFVVSSSQILREKLISCPHCGAKMFFHQTEWGDDDYPQFVSPDSKKTTKKRGITIWDDGTSESVILYDYVYDVNKVPENRWVDQIVF